jgi:hypothetical protein
MPPMAHGPSTPQPSTTVCKGCTACMNNDQGNRMQ